MYKRTHLTSPSSEECQQCKAYRPQIGCMEDSCAKLSAAIQDGTVTYRDLLMTIHPQPPTFAWTLQELAGNYLGTLWNDAEHRQRYTRLVKQIKSPMAVKPREVKRYVAALFLFATSTGMYQRTYRCVTPEGIDFSNAYTQKMSKEHSFMFHAARCLHEHRDEQLILNLEYSRPVYPQNLRVILHGILIARYGLAVFYLKGDGGC